MNIFLCGNLLNEMKIEVENTIMRGDYGRKNVYIYVYNLCIYILWKTKWELRWGPSCLLSEVEVSLK